MCSQGKAAIKKCGSRQTERGGQRGMMLPFTCRIFGPRTKGGGATTAAAMAWNGHEQKSC